MIVAGGELLMPGGRLQRSDVVIHDDKLVTIRPADDQSGDRAAVQQRPPAGEDHVIDARGCVVAPGFVDLQCNGAGGIDLTAEPERLWEVAQMLPRWGVTAWLPTLVSSPEPLRQRALAALARRSHAAAAEPLGLHFEGPFLSPQRPGAHAVAHLRRPSLDAVAGWSRAAGVTLVTLAPELPGTLEVIRALAERDVIVSLGHSMATVDQARAAVNAGARWITHIFNAMAPLHHRDPGLAGLALTDERVAVGVIADGFHLHPTAVDLVHRSVGDRLTLVTDAVAALGLPPGRVRLGDLEALADGETVRLADGTLAGSVLSMNQAVSNLMAYTGCGLADAVEAASATPTRVLGRQGAGRGAIVDGARADLVLLRPSPSAQSGQGGTPGQAELEVVTTIVGGRVAYEGSGIGRPS